MLILHVYERNLPLALANKGNFVAEMRIPDSVDSFSFGRNPGTKSFLPEIMERKYYFIEEKQGEFQRTERGGYVYIDYSRLRKNEFHRAFVRVKIFFLGESESPLAAKERFGLKSGDKIVFKSDDRKLELVFEIVRIA
ncbi:hypothetical protein HZA98_04415 [Candidatus Woesearchaeota archaeon]|nr:hypothetical protein [Candidatus Woesearchaeota archaeon]